MRQITILGEFILLVFLCFSIKASGSESYGYDNTLVLSVKQKFAIPENVSNGDYVGVWKKNITWITDGAISYSIVSNYFDAFSIDTSTGLITVSNSAKINGKVVAQDTVINLVIRTTDSKQSVYESDTAEIKIKENSYCKYIDYNYSGTESGSRLQPYNNLNDVTITPGYGYFIKRGNVFDYSGTAIKSHLATLNHPTIIGAYATGSNPVFDGNGKIGNNGCFFLGESGNEINGRSEHIYFYNLKIWNFAYYAFKAQRISGYIGWYNCAFDSCAQVYTEAMIIASTQSYTDSTAYRPHEMIDCEFINMMYVGVDNSFIKIGVGPVTIRNCSFKNSGGAGVRLTTGRYSSIKHCTIDNCANVSGSSSLQIKGDYATAEDLIITNAGRQGIEIATPITPHGPDACTIRNCYIQGGVYGIRINASDATFNTMHDHLIENCIITDGAVVGITVNNSSNMIIRHNEISNFRGDANIYFGNGASNKIVNTKIQYNTVHSGLANIVFNQGNGVAISNNTVDGDIDLTGSSNEVVRNTYFKSLSSAMIDSNNIDIDTITSSNHFVNYQNHNYHLKETAHSAIDHGFDWGQDADIDGTAKYGSKWDIGAQEYSPLDDTAENNPPVVEDQIFNVNEDNYSGNSIGKVIAEENDPEQSITYSIIAGNEAGLFTIDADLGNLWIIDAGIFDQVPENYNLLVQVTDNGEGNLSDQATVQIMLEKHEDIVYIDPENKNDGQENGTLAHPYDSWQDVEWISDYSYLQKKGTVADEPKISILANNIIIGAYGEGDQPTIRSTAEDYALSYFEKTNITIQNIHIVAENAISSVYFLGDISDNITIENSKFEGSIYGIRILGGKNFTIQYNTFRATSEAIYSYAENTKVYYNIFQNNQDALHIDGENSSAEVYNNVFYDNNTAVSTDYSELTLYNNIFIQTKNVDKAISYNGTKLISDNNIFYPNQDGFVSYNGVDFNNLADLQQLKAIDINSFVSDPLFIDAFNHNFAVESGSPAIDAGVFVGITADLIGEGVPFGNKPDIGAIEVSETVTSTTLNPADEMNNFVRIFPNPTNGVFNIALDNVEQQEANIHIQDINGNTIIEKQYSDLDTESDQSFDISDFPAGIYILSVQLAKTIYSQRILKIL